jgi:hypothetical protein
MKVTHAELHSSVVFQQTELLGVTTLNQAQLSKNVVAAGLIDMKWVPGDGLYVTTPKLKTRKRIGFIPAANVKCLEFEDEDVKDPKKIKAVI